MQAKKSPLLIHWKVVRFLLFIVNPKMMTWVSNNSVPLSLSRFHFVQGHGHLDKHYSSASSLGLEGLAGTIFTPSHEMEKDALRTNIIGI
ncbi:hypothetical protein Tsubulata_031980 [Turnera subulata]|uniref:Uncharacterized protein n=1 Tax=Turnera subulata TaxID=218843 RepID=A0A9Q0GGS2_9ROSI|nr:hypothetical protein Tsubulata_031980 [Turnera subulata]